MSNWKLENVKYTVDDGVNKLANVKIQYDVHTRAMRKHNNFSGGHETKLAGH